ncbi:hypothetical protein ACYF6T_33340 [Streptomyces sp. 7R007]
MTERSEPGPQDERDRRSTADDEVETPGGGDPAGTEPTQAEDGRPAPEEDESEDADVDVDAEQQHSKEWEAGWSGP